MGHMANIYITDNNRPAIISPYCENLFHRKNTL